MGVHIFLGTGSLGWMVGRWGLEGNGEGVFLKKKKDFYELVVEDKRSICENSTATMKRSRV